MTALNHIATRDLALERPTLAAVEARGHARRWMGLAVGSLVAAGLLALVLVIGRLPPLDALFTDPLFFKRCLVVHVDLAIVVWFLSFMGCLWFLLPTSRPLSPLARISPMLALAGLILMAITAAIPDVAPVLANYVPVLDHPLFMVGLVLFGSSLLAFVLDWRLMPSSEAHRDPSFIPPEARPALRAAGLAVLLAGFTFLAAFWTTPSNQPAPLYYEQLVWGGGHVLQFVSVAAMLAVWLTLLTPITGAPLSRKFTGLLFGLFILPLCLAPLMADSQADGSRVFFTRLMELGIFPVVSIVLIACVRALVRSKKPLRELIRDGRFIGFFASAFLTLVGFALGASIDGSNTMVPAHYHASIGAVTAAFMAISYPLAAHLGLAAFSPREARFARWQPLLFGFGQVIFAVGFGIAGAAGMMRKTYGAEQAQITSSSNQTLGLVVMGVGGLIAVVGGVLYMTLLIRAWRRTRRLPRPPHRSSGDLDVRPHTT